MTDDTKNSPAQPEFGELAPEGWSWNPEANAPHTPETLKAAEAAAKAAAKARAAHAAAMAKATASGKASGSAAAKPDKPARPSRGEKGENPADSAKADKAAKPARAPAPVFVAPSAEDESGSSQALSEAEKKSRAVALARLASDRFITWGLLGLAVFSVLSGLGDYLNLTRTLNALYDQLNTMEPGLNLAPYANPEIAKVLGWAIVMSQAVVIGLTFWWAIRRMRLGKLAFWIPVVGFAVSSALVLVAMVLAFFADPAAWETLVAYLQNAQAGTSAAGNAA